MSNDSWAMLSIGIKALKAKLVQLREANHKHRHHYSMMYDTLVFTRPLTLYQFELVEMLVKATPMCDHDHASLRNLRKTLFNAGLRTTPDPEFEAENEEKTDPDPV